MTVDAEALVSQFLRTQAPVIAAVADRVYTDLPHGKDRTYPLVLITRIGGGYIHNRPLWLANAVLQLDVFGGTHRQAHRLMGDCLEAMAGPMVAAHAEGCVTGVYIDALAYDPEEDFFDDRGHSRPRFTATVSVLTHP